MKKKKAVIEKWCPLTGQYKYFTLKHDYVIRRARALWRKPAGFLSNSKGVPYKTPEGRKIPTVAAFSGEDKEKARAIFFEWDALQKDHIYIWMLADNIRGAQNIGATNCEEFLLKTVSWFKELDPSPLEVFSILAIHEARVSENPEQALELLALTEKYTPDAMRGKKVIEAARGAGKATAATTKKEAREKREKWQARAEVIWRNNPKQSKNSVARIIARETGFPISTIRQGIVKLK